MAEPVKWVKAHYPKSVAVKEKRTWRIVLTETDPTILGKGRTEADAWVDAARKIGQPVLP